jgi:hypothetical protein
MHIYIYIHTHTYIDDVDEWMLLNHFIHACKHRYIFAPTQWMTRLWFLWVNGCSYVLHTCIQTYIHTITQFMAKLWFLWMNGCFYVTSYIHAYIHVYSWWRHYGFCGWMHAPTSLHTYKHIHTNIYIHIYTNAVDDDILVSVDEWMLLRHFIHTCIHTYIHVYSWWRHSGFCGWVDASTSLHRTYSCFQVRPPKGEYICTCRHAYMHAKTFFGSQAPKIWKRMYTYTQTCIDATSFPRQAIKGWKYDLYYEYVCVCIYIYTHTQCIHTYTNAYIKTHTYIHTYKHTGTRRW